MLPAEDNSIPGKTITEQVDTESPRHSLFLWPFYRKKLTNIINAF
jgi:hypothetical protein